MRARLRSLQLWTCVGWILVITLNLFCSYWLFLFASEYDTIVFSKWANASMQSLVHRFFSAPVFRALTFATCLWWSKFLPCCDACIACSPQTLPVEQLKAPVWGGSPSGVAEDHGLGTKSSVLPNSSDELTTDLD